MAFLQLQSILKQYSSYYYYYEQHYSTLYYLAIFGFITIFLVLNFTITKKGRKSNNLPPSPPKLPFIGNLHQLGTLPHRSFHELSKKHGPLMSLQLGQTPAIVVSSVDVAKEIIKNHDVVFSNRPQTTSERIIMYGCKDVAFAPYGDEWRQKRKICVLELLSLKRVRSFQSIREEEVAELVDSLRETCGSNKESCVNLSELIIATSNNIVSRCVLGQKYDNNPDGSGSFGELGRKMMRELAAFSVGDFFPFLGWLDFLTGQIQEFKATFHALDCFYDKVLEEHRRMIKKGNDDKKDFVDLLLQVQEDGVHHDFHLSNDNLKAILMDVFAGGGDTTSTLLEWTFAELIKNPKIMKKVQEEVRNVVGYKQKIDENDVNEMEYMKCVIKEILRLHPPAPLLIPRETLSDVKLKGYDIPSKTKVYLNAWTIQRDPEIWNNPEEFIPERFEKSQIDFMGQHLELIPFGFGRRGCAGISFAIASTEHILANLLCWFDWKLPNNNNNDDDDVGVTKMQDIDMCEIYGLTVCKKVPLHLQPKLYNHMGK
ncbi:phenylacetaldehyde oxime monooxygenase CYP71AN24-like [Arachis hypogaea]|uniref:Cytochrome P450 n=1 Tax=Arachis hypogaea TaxID=3818 RepID=A0A445DWL6_ARAHY|nr:cytochrome P450 71A1-like [Arachis hypogaea]QHO57412.1 Cytochrome P450 [Arachis hypogaea]RYR67580.1 hypothetical protein Ahy_A03g013978 [Arachis hypogaea]